MIVLKGRNVNTLLPLGVDHLSEFGVASSSRAGDVIVAPTPVCSVYEQPCERVLFSKKRDANPFFHLFESLWMLAGREDSASLDNYVHDYGSRFGDDGVIHGAYGHRWRRVFGFDQIEAVVAKLRANPDDRQCVIQMWDASPGPRNDLLGAWKDRPCNTHVYLRVRLGVLDLTVLCRSNDIVWGAYGANAVHFSFLQEYLAGRIGVGVGRMYQFSNNYHGYVAALDRLGEPHLLFEEHDPYDTGEVHSISIGTDWSAWDEDLREFMSWHMSWHSGSSYDLKYKFKNTWFRDVATPVCWANYLRQRDDYTGAIDIAHRIAAKDWRTACIEWLERRMR